MDPVQPQTTNSETPPEIPVDPVAQTQQPPQKKKRKLPLIGVIIAGALLLGGGSAAAYFGYVVPNKPENVLRTALMNSFEDPQGDFEGTIAVNGGGSGLLDSAEISVEGSLGSNGFTVKTTLNIFGAEVPAELRFVEDKAYVRLEDISVISGFLTLSGTENSSDIAALLAEAEGDWFAIDESLIGDVTSLPEGCTLDTSSVTPEASNEKLIELFEANEFITAVSSESDDVDGAAATKIELKADKDTFKKFVTGLFDTVKSTQDESCNQGLADTDLQEMINTIDELEVSNTSFYAWVTKDDKRIKKISIEGKAQDTKIETTMVVDYKQTTIETPSEPRSISELIEEFQPLIDSLGGSL